MAGTFVIERGSSGKYHFNLRAGGNYEKLLTSEAYEAKAGAEGGIDSVRRNAKTTSATCANSKGREPLLHAHRDERASDRDERDVLHDDGEGKRHPVREGERPGCDGDRSNLTRNAAARHPCVSNADPRVFFGNGARLFFIARGSSSVKLGGLVSEVTRGPAVPTDHIGAEIPEVSAVGTGSAVVPNLDVDTATTPFSNFGSRRTTAVAAFDMAVNDVSHVRASRPRMVVDTLDQHPAAVDDDSLDARGPCYAGTCRDSPRSAG